MHSFEEVPRQRDDLVQVGLQRPMSAIEQVKLRLRQIPQIGTRRALGQD